MRSVLEKAFEKFDDNARLRIAEEIIQAVGKGRMCGDCTYCCRVTRVEALLKPAGQACHHLCDHGCAIYAERPMPCRAFYCSWRAGMGEEHQRPDKVGFIGLLPDDYSQGFNLVIQVDREAEVIDMEAAGTLVSEAMAVLGIDRYRIEVVPTRAELATRQAGNDDFVLAYEPRYCGPGRVKQDIERAVAEADKAWHNRKASHG